MDTKKVRAILTAVEKGSLTSAAAELGYTQSGLTHMMNALENELGLNLLVRSKNGVHLSSAGQELLPRMRALLEASDALEQGVEQIRQRGTTTLRLGAYTSVTRHWVPSVLAEFRRMSPETEVLIHVGGNEDIYEKLRNDELDCAIVSLQRSLSQGLSFMPLVEDRLLAILPGDIPTEGGAFPLEAFRGKEFLMPSAGFYLDIEPLFPQGIEKVASRVQRINLEDAAIVSMVEHGLGVSILSDLIMCDMNSGVRALPLQPPASRELGIAMSERRRNDRNIRRFIRCTQTVIGQMYST